MTFSELVKMLQASNVKGVWVYEDDLEVTFSINGNLKVISLIAPDGEKFVNHNSVTMSSGLETCNDYTEKDLKQMGVHAIFDSASQVDWRNLRLSLCGDIQASI